MNDSRPENKTLATIIRQLKGAYEMAVSVAKRTNDVEIRQVNQQEAREAAEVLRMLGVEVQQ